MPSLSNYPPGVTGHEPQIAGQDELPAEVEDLIDGFITDTGSANFPTDYDTMYDFLSDFTRLLTERGL